MRALIIGGLALGVILLLAIMPGRAIHALSPYFPGADDEREAATGQPTKPVIVELFTSEGCSSCPPADRLLARLDETQPVAGAQVIALEQHVDYWNDLGWTDPFSSALFSHRQEGYARPLHFPTVYTPQMIVDGATEFVGSEESAALAAIRKAARASKAAIELQQRTNGHAGPQTLPLRVHAEPAPSQQAGEDADVLLAITESGLASNVTCGENSGATLNHRAVVRDLRVLGQVRSGASFSADPDVNLGDGWKRANLRVVVFEQERTSHRILGAAALQLSGDRAQ